MADDGDRIDRAARLDVICGLRMLVVCALLGVALALASSVVRGTRLEVQDWDCPPAPASCARPVLVRGFPLPYISDHHGISPVGSADLVGALLGMDHLHRGALAVDAALYALLAVAVHAATTRATRATRE